MFFTVATGVSPVIVRAHVVLGLNIHVDVVAAPHTWLAGTHRLPAHPFEHSISSPLSQSHLQWIDERRLKRDLYPNERDDERYERYDSVRPDVLTSPVSSRRARKASASSATVASSCASALSVSNSNASSFGGGWVGGGGAGYKRREEDASGL
jgi:hypothetical protein